MEQRSVIEYSSGLSNLQLLPYLLRPNTTEGLHMCHSQKACRGDYINFNILGMAIILCVGALLICINFTLSTLVG